MYPDTVEAGCDQRLEFTFLWEKSQRDNKRTYNNDNKNNIDNNNNNSDSSSSYSNTTKRLQRSPVIKTAMTI